MKDAIFALLARSMFLTHGVVCFWKVTDQFGLGNVYVWFLLIPMLTLCAEGLYTVSMRGGEEYNWVSPCIFLYLCCVVPPIWFLEYKEYQNDMEMHICITDWNKGDDPGCMYDFGHMLGMQEKFPEINDIMKDSFIRSTACAYEGLFRYDPVEFFNVTGSKPGWWDYTIKNFQELEDSEKNKHIYYKYNNLKIQDPENEDNELNWDPINWERGKHYRDRMMEQTKGFLNWTIREQQIAYDKKMLKEQKEKELEKKCKKYEQKLLDELAENPPPPEYDEDGYEIEPGITLPEDDECYKIIMEVEDETASAGVALGALAEGNEQYAQDLQNANALIEDSTKFMDEFFENLGMEWASNLRTWITIFHQFMLFILILARWMLPKSAKITRDQLSQILLTFIGVAADMLEFVTETGKEVVIKCEFSLLALILLFWSWSTLQFVLVLTGNTKPTTRQVPIYDSKHASPIMWIEEEIERPSWEKFVFKNQDV